MTRFCLKDLVKEITLCTSLLSKARGLMFTKKRDRALVFIYGTDAKRSLHMFFVFYPIDVLFLDKEKKVVEIRENFRPSTMYMPKHSSRYIIEMPAAKVQEHKIKVNDTALF